MSNPNTTTTTTNFSQQEIDQYAQTFGWAIAPTINPQTLEEEYWLQELICLINGEEEYNDEAYLQSLPPLERQELLQQRTLVKDNDAWENAIRESLIGSEL